MAIYVNAKSLAKVFMLKNKDKLRLGTVINEIELAEKGISRNVDFVEVKHGHWIDDVQDVPPLNGYIKRKTLVGYRCSLCNRAELKKEPYCNCGAKMDGGKQG